MFDYDPQRLLTDQRDEQKKFTDAMLEQCRRAMELPYENFVRDFGFVGTPTGRYQVDPEMQDLRRRRAFDEGVVLVTADYEAIELGVLVHLALAGTGEAVLIDLSGRPEGGSIEGAFSLPCDAFYVGARSCGKTDAMFDRAWFDAITRPTKAKQLKPPPEYLRHDPTKQNRRRRR